jgi:hypothetical protein
MIEKYLEHEEFLEKRDFERVQITIEDIELEIINGHLSGDGDKIEDVKDDDEKPIGKTPSGWPLYAGEDPGSIYKIKPEKDTLLDLRKRQFCRIQEIKEEMKEKGDNRHLFLIEKSWLLESQKGFNGHDFWKGYLIQDVLAVKGKNGLELIPFVKGGEIKVSYSDPYNCETRFRKIPHFNARNNRIPELDLTTTKINNSEELNEAILLLKKK